MATIIENVRRKQSDFLKNPVLAGQNMAMAIAAMRDGIKSSAWEFYMTQFARNEVGSLDKDQLARLMGTDNTLGDPILDRQRAYLVGNAFCGMSTTDLFDFGVESVDNGLTTAVVPYVAQICETTTIGAAPRPGTKKPGYKKGVKKGAKKASKK